MTVALAILAGGQGKRLGGVAKGLLRHGERTLIEAQLALGVHFDETLIVANDGAPYLALGQRHGARSVADMHPGLGAPGGVHAALVHAGCEWVIALACDMPFVTWPVLARLLDERAPEVDAVAFDSGERLEPFPSLWRRDVAPKLAGRLEAQPSLRSLLSSLRLRRVALASVDPSLRATRSVNLPEELGPAGVDWPSRERL